MLPCACTSGKDVAVAQTSVLFVRDPARLQARSSEQAARSARRSVCWRGGTLQQLGSLFSSLSRPPTTSSELAPAVVSLAPVFIPDLGFLRTVAPCRVHAVMVANLICCPPFIYECCAETKHVNDGIVWPQQVVWLETILYS